MIRLCKGSVESRHLRAMIVSVLTLLAHVTEFLIQTTKIAKKKKSAEHGTSTKIVDEFPKLYSNLSLSRSGRLGMDWLVTSWPFAGPDFYAQYVLVRFCYPQAYAQRRRGAGGSQIFHCTWRSMRCVRHSQPSSASPMPHNPNVDPCTQLHGRTLCKAMELDVPWK